MFLSLNSRSCSLHTGSHSYSKKVALKYFWMKSVLFNTGRKTGGRDTCDVDQQGCITLKNVRSRAFRSMLYVLNTCRCMGKLLKRYKMLTPKQIQKATIIPEDYIAALLRATEQTIYRMLRHCWWLMGI